MKKNPFKKTIVYLLLFVLLSGLTLSGCRKKAPPKKKETYQGVELTYYKVFDDEEVLDPVLRKYETDHPGLIIHYRKFSDFNEYQRVILNEMAEGEGPDIFSMQNTWFMSNYKKISPMPERFGTPADFAETFVDVAYRDLVRPDQNGKEQVYALPMTIDTLALYYNKAHFEDRIPSRGQPSKTWEGIKEDVALLNKANNSLERFEVSGIALGRADNISRGVDILYLLFLQFGVKFYNENVSAASFAGQQPGASMYPGIEALKLFASFADESQKHYSWNELMVDDDSQSKEVEAFAKGKVSMIVGYSYTYDDIVNEIKSLEDKGGSLIKVKDIGIAPIPQLYDPDVSKDKRVTYANYFAETVSRNSKYPEVAWDLLLELTENKKGKKNLEQYFKKTHNPTSRRDMIDDQKKDPIYGVFASQVGYAESFPILDYYVYKDLFQGVVANANLVNVNNSSLLDAQRRVSEMLPKDGLIGPPPKDDNVKPEVDAEEASE